MLTKNFFIVACAVSSIIGLALIYFVAVTAETKSTNIGEITSDSVGKSVSAVGTITYRSNHPAGHIFLTVADGNSKIEVPLFSGFVTKLEESGVDSSYFSKGTKIQVKGLVDQYKGSLQIIPRKVDDIKILSGGGSS